MPRWGTCWNIVHAFQFSYTRRPLGPYQGEIARMAFDIKVHSDNAAWVYKCYTASDKAKKLYISFSSSHRGCLPHTGVSINALYLKNGLEKLVEQWYILCEDCLLHTNPTRSPTYEAENVFYSMSGIGRRIKIRSLADGLYAHSSSSKSDNSQM
jgi:hypothetical protein